LKPGQPLIGTDGTVALPEDTIKAAWDKINTESKLGRAKEGMEESQTAVDEFGDLTTLKIPGWVWDGGAKLWRATGAGIGEDNRNIGVGTTLTMLAMQQAISKDSTFKKAIQKANGSSGRLAAAKQGGDIRRANPNPDYRVNKSNPVTTPSQQPTPPGPNATDQQKRDYRKSVQQQSGSQATDPQARAEKAKKLKADWIEADKKLASSYKDFANKHGYKAGPKPPANGGTPDERRQWRKATIEHFKNEVANHRKTMFKRFSQRVKNYSPGGKAKLAGWIASGAVIADAAGSLIKSFGLSEESQKELDALIAEAKKKDADYKALLKEELAHNAAYRAIVNGTPAPTDSGANMISPNANPPPTAPPPIPASIIQSQAGGSQTPGGGSIAPPPSPTAIQTPTGGTQTPGGGSIAPPPPPPETVDSNATVNPISTPQSPTGGNQITEVDEQLIRRVYQLFMQQIEAGQVGPGMPTTEREVEEAILRRYGPAGLKAIDRVQSPSAKRRPL
jgi:hypothetical protein